MRQLIIALGLTTPILGLIAFGSPARAQADTASHRVMFVSVQPDVRLEVLDWGGTGTPIVVLAGSGATAHAYDDFAPDLTKLGHVYGITRRGSGGSSAANSGYDAQTLGHDILAVVDSLRLDRPLLIGNSFAGEELSEIGSTQPKKVRGLVYVDAAFFYAFYDSTRGNAGLEMLELRRKLDRVESGPFANYQEFSSLLREIANVDLPRLQRSLRSYANTVDSAGPRTLLPHPAPTPMSSSDKAHAGIKMFEHIDAPVLAFFPIPHRGFPPDTRTSDSTFMVADAASFQRVVPSAKIVVVHDADHVMWRSNKAELLRGIVGFLMTLK